MKTLEVRYPNPWEVYSEDLGSDEFFELDLGSHHTQDENEEIGDGFDYQAYDRALTFRRFARQLLGLG